MSHLMQPLFEGVRAFYCLYRDAKQQNAAGCGPRGHVLFAMRIRSDAPDVPKSTVLRITGRPDAPPHRAIEQCDIS